MGQDPDVEDSQVFDQNDELPGQITPPNLGQQHPVSDEVAPNLHSDAFDPAAEPDSYASRVVETQLVTLEPASFRQETQVTQQESLVNETQFVDIEPVTQPITWHATQSPEAPPPALVESQLQLSPTTRRVNQLAAATNDTPKSLSVPKFISAITRPENILEDVRSSFQFAAATKHTTGQFSRPTGTTLDRSATQRQSDVADLPEKSQQGSSRQNSSAPRRANNDSTIPTHEESNNSYQIQRLPPNGNNTDHGDGPVVDRQATNNTQIVPSTKDSEMKPLQRALNKQQQGGTSAPTAESKSAHNSTDSRSLKHTAMGSIKHAAEEVASRNQPSMLVPPTKSQNPNPLTPVRIAPPVVPTPTRGRAQPRMRTLSGSRRPMLRGKPPFPDADRASQSVTASNTPRPTDRHFRGTHTTALPVTEQSLQAHVTTHRESLLHGNGPAMRALSEDQLPPIADQSRQMLAQLPRELGPQVPSCEVMDQVDHEERLSGPKTFLDSQNQYLRAASPFVPNNTHSNQQISNTNHRPRRPHPNNAQVQNALPRVQGPLEIHGHSTIDEAQQCPQIARKQQQGQNQGSNPAVCVAGPQDSTINHFFVNDRHSSVQPESRPSSSMSRPHSRRSNHGKSMYRPFPEEEMELERVSQSPIKKFGNSSKVKKSKGGQSQTDHRTGPIFIPVSGDHQVVSKPTSDFRKFIQTAERIEKDLSDFEIQRELIKTQAAEIEKLDGCSKELKKMVDSLEAEKQELTTKINKFMGICEKYKAHMNDVVDCQKDLMTEAIKIKKNKKAASQEGKTVLEELRRCAEIQVDQEKQLRSLRGGIAVVKVRAIDTDKEQKALQEKVDCLERNRLSLNAELDTRVNELGGEKYKVEQLQKQITAQNSAHKEQIALAKDIQSNVINELTKEDGILAKLLKSGDSSLAKVEGLSILIDELKSNEPGVPPALVTLIEDVHTRIEKKLQITENNGTAQQESDTKLFDDLKERIDQVRTDQELETRLKGEISQLREAKATLAAELSAREAQCQGLTTRIDELDRDLKGCRDQLTAKTEELTKILASPKEDLQLSGKVHELQQANSVLQEQLDATRQESNRIKSDLQSLEEASTEAANQRQELEQKLSKAGTLIKNAEEDKKAYIASAQVDIERAKQEVANSAKASRDQLQMRHDSQVKNLEQRRSEAESQLKAAKDELQKLHDERRSSTENEGMLLAEIATCKEQLAQQDAKLKAIMEGNPTPEQLENRTRDINAVRDELAEFRNAVEAEQTAKFQGLETVRQTHREFGDRIPQVAQLQQDMEILQEQNIALRSKYEILSGSAARHLTRTGHLQPGLTLEEWATTVPLVAPEDMAPPRKPLQTVGNNASATTAGPHHSGARDERIVHQNITPREALQLASRRRSTVSSNGGRDYPTPSDSTEKHGSTSGRERKTINNASRATGNLAIENEIFTAQSAAKPLRAANRKGSSLAQQADPAQRESHRNRSVSRGMSSGVTHSTVTRTTHRTEETTIQVETPRSGIVPFQDMTPLGSQSSDLTEVNMYEIMDNIESQRSQKYLQDNLPRAYEIARSEKAGLSSMARHFANETQARNPASQQHGSMPQGKIPSLYQSDEDELANDFIHKPVSAPAKNPQTSFSNKQLKSAMKKTSGVENDANGGGYFTSAQSTTSKAVPAPVLQNKPSGHGVNKIVPRPKATSNGSNYRRVATGQGRVLAQNRASREQMKPPQKQEAMAKHHSPLPPASKRNTQKRKASDMSGEGREHSRGSKAPRLSLPRRRLGNEVADSQEVQYGC